MSLTTMLLYTIIRIGRAEEFIVALSELIQRLTVDHLHIVGDIYDRGPGPHIIMEKLMEHHSVDIQWGNHDVLWMGAAAGQRGCIANVIRICARYGNLDILEEGYGINLLPLATFAMATYGDDPCECFQLKGEPNYSQTEMLLDIKMHKAMSHHTDWRWKARSSKRIQDSRWKAEICCIISTMKREQ